MGGVGRSRAPLGGLLVLVWVVGVGGLVVPFPLTAGLPLVGSASCCASNRPPLHPCASRALSNPQG